MMLQVKNLSFSYSKSRKIINSVSFSLAEKEVTSLIGANGSGKSTLLKCLLGLLPISSGQVTFDGKDLSFMSRGEIARKVAYIPQASSNAFAYTAMDMVLMGTTPGISGYRSPGPRERRSAKEAMERLDILRFSDHDYGTLSGGEKQMVLIARAIAQRTDILLMDEPTASLDYGNQIRVMECIRSLASEGYTILQSTHDPQQAFLFSDHILALADGKLAASGKPQEVISSDLISRLYHIDASIVSLFHDKVRICIPGSVKEEKESVT